jgi:hypothetical protein
MSKLLGDMLIIFSWESEIDPVSTFNVMLGVPRITGHIEGKEPVNDKDRQPNIYFPL